MLQIWKTSLAELLYFYEERRPPAPLLPLVVPLLYRTQRSMLLASHVHRVSHLYGNPQKHDSTCYFSFLLVFWVLYLIAFHSS